MVHSCGSTVKRRPSYRISAFDMRLILEPNSGIGALILAGRFYYGDAVDNSRNGSVEMEDKPTKNRMATDWTRSAAGESWPAMTYTRNVTGLPTESYRIGISTPYEGRSQSLINALKNTISVIKNEIELFLFLVINHHSMRYSMLY